MQLLAMHSAVRNDAALTSPNLRPALPNHPTTAVVGMSGPRDACPGSELPWHSVEDVKRAVFADVNPGGITVGSTYSRCSLGKTKLTRNNSLVAPLVRLPCQGVRWEHSGRAGGGPWVLMAPPAAARCCLPPLC